MRWIPEDTTQLRHVCGGGLAIDYTKKVKIEPAADSVEGSDLVYCIICVECGEHLGTLANVDQGRCVRAC